MTKREFFSALFGAPFAIRAAPPVAKSEVHIPVNPMCPHCGLFMYWLDRRERVGELSKAHCPGCNLDIMAPQSIPIR